MARMKQIVLDLIEKEEHRKTLWRILIFMLAVTVIADFLVERHAEFAWIFPGFAALYGFFSCIFIIVFSKWIGHKWLMKDEDYWERQDGLGETGVSEESIESEGSEGSGISGIRGIGGKGIGKGAVEETGKKENRENEENKESKEPRESWERKEPKAGETGKANKANNANNANKEAKETNLKGGGP